MPKRKRNETDESSQNKPSSSKDTIEQNAIENVTSFSITSKGKPINCERRGDSKPALIFTHGAGGGGLSNPAMTLFADGFADLAPIVSFQGNMNMESRIKSFQAVLSHEETTSTAALGGRSMGARAAVLTAQQTEGRTAEALVLVSYPMVGARKGDLREQILLDLSEGVDVLFISGTNDSMCTMKHLRTVVGKMKARSWILEVEGAGHGMDLKQKAAVEPIRREMGRLAAQWLQERDESKRYSSLGWEEGKEEIFFSSWWSNTKEKDSRASK